LREPHSQRGGTLRVRIGRPIAWKEIAALGLPRLQVADRIADEVYSVGSQRVVKLRTEIPIAHPEDRLALRRELQRAAFLGQAHDGKQIRLFDAQPGSAVMRELGRLREIAFRGAGEGTGRKRDVDAFDAYYRHVVVWDDADLQIVGAYRIGEVSRILETH